VKKGEDQETHAVKKRGEERKETQDKRQKEVILKKTNKAEGYN
jgi:hypothetical protein